MDSNFKKYYEILKDSFCLFNNCKYQSALKRIDKAQEINKNGCFDFFITKANILFNLKKHKQALESINQAIKLNRNLHRTSLTEYPNEVFLIKGNILYELECKEECLKCYKKGLKKIEKKEDINKFKNYFIYRANVLIELDRKEEALLIYDDYISKSSEEYYWIFINKAEILKSIGKYEEALQSYYKAIHLAGNGEIYNIYLKIAKLYFYLNNKEKAFENLKNSMNFEDLNVIPFLQKHRFIENDLNCDKKIVNFIPIHKKINMNDDDKNIIVDIFSDVKTINIHENKKEQINGNYRYSLNSYIKSNKEINGYINEDKNNNQFLDNSVNKEIYKSIEEKETKILDIIEINEGKEKYNQEFTNLREDLNKKTLELLIIKDNFDKSEKNEGILNLLYKNLNRNIKK